jgi:methionyl-tRNA synthetase
VLAKEEATRARLGTVLYTASDGLRALAVLLSPVLPNATEKLWDALGAGSLGTVWDQPIRSAGEWGQLPVGSPVSALQGLFPRIESTAPVA